MKLVTAAIPRARSMPFSPPTPRPMAISSKVIAGGNNAVLNVFPITTLNTLDDCWARGIQAPSDDLGSGSLLQCSFEGEIESCLRLGVLFLGNASLLVVQF